MAKILIADDEPAILEVLRRTLEFEGHQSFLASDGATTLQRIETEEPDLVLLDVMMPVMDGWEVLRRLGETQARKPPRVIVMTAKGGERDIAKGLELGASEYVTKPFEIDQLMKLITDVLARSPEEMERRRSALLEKFVS